MKYFESCAVVLLLCISCVTVQGQNYTKIYAGYQIARFHVDSQTELRNLEAFVGLHLSNIDVLRSSHQVPGSWDILVPPEFLNSFQTLLHSLKHEIISTDVDRDVEMDRERNGRAHHRARRRRRSSDIVKSHDHYRNTDEIQSWLYSKARDHKIATVSIIGHTYEYRPLFLLKVSKSCDKPIIWIDGGIHAREWIAPATALMLIDYLLEDSAESKFLLDHFQFYILPLVNPDGYEYTHKYARYWRKNRSRTPRTSCLGVDLNRNFPYKWGGGGSSDDPCSQTYRGLRSHSELETQAIMSALTEVKDKTELFISLHSFGQYIMPPFGHASLTYPRLYKKTIEMSHKVSSLLYKKYKKFYMIGSSADIMYAAAGGSCDYAAGVLDIPYSVTIELPDRGRYGFLLPPEHIAEVGKQMWDLVIQYAQFILT